MLLNSQALKFNNCHPRHLAYSVRFSLLATIPFLFYLSSPLMAQSFTSGTTAAKFGTHEISLTGNGSVSNPFDTIATVTLTPPSGNSVTVRAFYDGGNSWRARVYVTEAGAWNWTSSSATDSSLNGVSSTFTAQNSNLPGILKKDALNPKAWRTDSGKWFVPISDVSWMLFSGTNPESIQYWQQYVQDDVARGINVIGPVGALSSNGTDSGPAYNNGNNDPWQSTPNLDLTRYNISKFQNAESRLIWIFNNYPNEYVQSLLFGKEQQFSWSQYSQDVRNNTMDYMIARWSAFPNVYWLISQDQEKTLNATLNFNREVGAYFEDHEPWKHLLSTEFHRSEGFPLTTLADLNWLDYVSLQDPNGPGANQIQNFSLGNVPLLIQLEDVDEQSSLTYSDPRFYFRWGMWSWIMSGGAYSYGGRWETIQPYYQTGRSDLLYVDSLSGMNWTGTQLHGLDSTAYIWPYLQSRNIDLSLFQPNDNLVTAWAMRPGDVWRPKLMRRGNEEFLVYDPHAFSEGPAADVDQTRVASMTIDFTSVSNNFVVEWYRPYDGVTQNSGSVQGGTSRTFIAPWQGYDVVLRIIKSDPDIAPPTVSITSPANNSTVSDTITITATASDNIGVAGVQFQLDGVAFGTEDITFPYSILWDTTTAGDGSAHAITAVARDAAGNTATASPVSIIVSNPDRTPPTAPANLIATLISTSQVSLSWTASTDNIAVTGYRVERCQGIACSNFVQIAAPTQTGYSDQALGAASYSYRVRAADAAGNVSQYSSVVNAVTSSAVSYGLEWPGDGAVRRMLYWHNPFPIYNATYIFKVYPRKKTTGTIRYYTTFFWGNDGEFVWDGGHANTYYGAHPYPIPAPAGPGQWEISINGNDYVSGSEVQWNRWHAQAFRAWRESPSITHHEFYWDWPDTSKVISQDVVDSAWANRNPPTPAIVIGQAPDFNGVSWGGYPGWEEFNGVIRGIQIYSGLLSLADIQSEISAPKSTTAGQNLMWYLNLNPRPNDVTDKKGMGTLHDPSWSGTTATEWADQPPPPDTTPPSIPTNLTATAVSSSQISLSWTASTDNVAVTTYIAERCQGTGCMTFTQIATISGTSYTDAGLAPTTSYSYRVRAADAAGNLSGYSNVTNATTNALPPPDTTPPASPANLVATATSPSQINLNWTASTDNVGVTQYLLERCQPPGCTTFTQIATPSISSYNDAGLAASTGYNYRVRAIDAAGNLSSYSNVAGATTATPLSGPVAAYAFNEGAGTTVSDLSGNGNTGTISGATWTTLGKYGAALSFNGTNNLVLLNNSASLNLSTAMTLEAWVFPAASQSGWRTIIQRQTDTYFLHAGSDSGPLRPAGGGTINSAVNYVVGPVGNPVNSWTHLALTYNGSTIALYVNGNVAASQAAAGPIQTNTNPVRIGGNVPYGEYFNGRIDEVRIYNRALSQAEIQTDMNTLIDTIPPAAPANLGTGTISASQINLNWTASTDNIAVTGYKVERCQGPGCANFAQVGISTSTAYSDTGLQAGTSYSYRVRATDAAANLSGYSNTTSAATGPTAPGNLAAVATGGSQINLTWTASTSAIAISDYRVERCQGTGCTNFIQIATAVATSYTDTGLTAVTAYSYRVRATDTNNTAGAYSNTGSATTADTVAPSVPSNLTAAAMTSTQINLSWTASTDNVAVARYLLERCQGVDCTSFAPIASPGGTTYSDTGLTANTSYSYRVQATDAAGNLSAYSNIVAATTPVPDAAAPSDPTSLTAAASGTSQINLDWLASTDNIGVTGYRLERCQGSGCTNFAQIGTPVSTVYSNIGLQPGTSYSYRVRATDASANLSGYSNTAAAATNAAPPANLAATASGGTQIGLTWTAPVSAIGISNYIVEHCEGAGCTNFVQIGAPTTTSYTDTGLTPATAYSYRVRASETDNAVTGYSNIAAATTADTVAPSVPSNLTAAAASTTQISLSWTASTDNLGVTGYQLERCQGVSCATFAQIATPATTTYSDTGLTANSSYSYRVRATDTAGNLSGYSNPTTAVTTDTVAPSVPSNLTATVASTTQINLTWTASTDNDAVAGYQLERCQGVSCATFAQIATPATATYSDSGLTTGTSFSYRVRATDAAGNLSGYSNTASAVTTDTVPPSVPSNLTATAASTTQINLTWIAATDNIAVSGYRLERCQGAGCTTFAQIAAPTTTTYSDTGLTPSTAYSYRVRATDAAGNLSGYSNTASATTTDTVAPSAPSSLTTTVVSATRIDLSWAASTDNVGVTGYRVERCQGANCTTFAQIATPIATTYSNTGLTAGTSYSYRVRAVDAAGNLSAYSNTASAIASAPPTAPASLTATASGGTQINLNWTASTSSAGVSDYRVERCQGTGCSNFTQVATSTTTSYADGGLTPATRYFYRVRARDTNNTLSGYSNTANATTTDTIAPSAPSSLAATSASSTQINLTWTASTDNVAVTGYRVERCQGAGCSIFTQTATPATTSYGDTGLAAATSYSYRVRAADAAGNPGGYSNVATATTQITPPANAPAAAYGFNEGTGLTTIDASGSGWAGTLTNGPLWTTGKNGNAISFDGVDDKVSLPSTLDISALPVTLEAWVRPANFSNWRVIFSKRNSYSASGMRIDVGLQMTDGKVFITTFRSTVTFTYAPPLNTWTHLAVVADSTGSKLYVNGILQQTLGVITLGSGSSAAVNIGRTGDNADPFAGLIDDLRLYKRALSQSEIQSDMNSPVP
ncbi:MAG TPA: fibronectin type III domain-containing protein [Terriglobia bacterium]|nr:fibronectin type III domain-containing protein [Terriglobia bacterium]